MLDTIALVGSAAGAIMGAIAAHLSIKARAARRLRNNNNNKDTTVKVGNRSYKVKPDQREEIEKILSAR